MCCDASGGNEMALCDATAEGVVIESPEYWQSAVGHLRVSFPSISPAAAVSSAPAASTDVAARSSLQMA
jgi:hypothetical protein